MERPRPSTVAWGVLAGGVLAYDILSPRGETLSERADAWIDHENLIVRYGTYAAIGVTALHLSNVLPPGIDPFHQLTRWKNQQE